MTEKIIAAVYGITSAKRVIISWARTPVGEAGEVIQPENSLFFTDNRILVVAVPLLGVGWNIGDADVSQVYALIGVNKLKERGDEMVKTMTPKQILELNEKNFEIPYNSIMEVKIKNGLFSRFVIFKLTGGKNYKYLIYKKEQFELLRRILTQLLPNKVNK